MKYEGLDKVDPLLKPYIVDSLQRREVLEFATLQEITKIYKKAIFRLSHFIQTHYAWQSKMENVSPALSEQIDKEFDTVARDLYKAVSKSLWQAILLALAKSSPEM